MAERATRPRLNFVELAKTPIALVLEHYGIVLTPTKNGKGLRGACPLPVHKGRNDNTPFGVNLEGNYWQCFSPECQEARGGRRGGNCINFVQSQEGISDYYEAAARLQAIVSAGVPTEQKGPALQVVKAVADPVTEKAERFMAELDRELDGELRPILSLLDSETAGMTQDKRTEVVILKLKKAIKRRVLSSYRNGKKAGEGG